MNDLPRLPLLPLAAALALAACTQPSTATPEPAQDPAADAAAPSDDADAKAAAQAAQASADPAAAIADARPAAEAQQMIEGDPAARDAVVAALRKFATLKRYRATMSTSAGGGGKPIVTTLDFVAPDRYRIESPGAGTQVIIGQTMYLEVDGRRMKVAAPANALSQWRSATAIADAAASLTARADGRQMVAAQPSAKFIVTQATPTPVQTTLWVGPQGYPIRLDTADGRTSIRYSRYDDPELKIEPPK